MRKSELNILIIEDDSTLGSAIRTAFKRAGYEAVLARDFDSAKAAFKLHDFHGLVIDCMLPGRSGVEVAQELEKLSSTEHVLVLTSGVYKDRNFARDASNKVKAKKFFVKPFNIEELILLFDSEFRELLKNQDAPLHELLEQTDYSRSDKINAIQSTNFVHGFDLPFVYSLLSDPQTSATLKIKYENKEADVSFFNGQVSHVHFPDKESYFGTLLIEHGFTSPSEVNEILNSEGDKPIGERLVEASFLSPHAIHIIQLEQMLIRLSKTIEDSSVEIELQLTEPEQKTPTISAPHFATAMADWIDSKLNPEWLKSFYLSRMDRALVRGADFSKVSILLENPIAKPLTKQLLADEWPHTLQEVMTSCQLNENEFLKAIHYMALNRVLAFAPTLEQSKNDIANHATRLNKIWDGMEGQNHFQILGLSNNARSLEIQRAYQKMAKALHPDKLGTNADTQLLDMANKVFGKITEAYNILSNESTRKKYLQSLAVGNAEEALRAESMFEQAFHLLQINNYRQARKAFEAVLKVSGHRSDTAVYYLWALILEKRKKVDQLELYEMSSKMLRQIPHEDRHTAPYFFVKGLIYALQGDLSKAYGAMKKVLTINPDFRDAQREKMQLKQFAKQNSGVVEDGFTSITRIFKRKKSS